MEKRENHQQTLGIKKIHKNKSIWRPDEKQFGLMGILNITPDSFYDGGKFFSSEHACKHAQRMIAQGADIIDLGGESTRPGAREITAAEEIKRLFPAFTAIREYLPDTQLSIDTWRAQTAHFFLERGAAVINDVSGFAWDPALLDVLAEFRPNYTLVHSNGRPANMQASPCYDNVVDNVKSWFENKLSLLTRAGLPEENIVLDPGIGFGKNLAHNLALMKNLKEFLTLGFPLLLGISMKSWLKNLLGLSGKDLGSLTAEASAILWQKGAFWHRVHEPEKVLHALELACTLA